LFATPDCGLAASGVYTALVFADLSDQGANMPVTKEQVMATAALCRLNFSAPSANAAHESAEERVARIAAQLDAVVGYMDILNQVDTKGVEPLYSPLEHIAPPRKDVVKKQLAADDVLANAPKHQRNFFVVPPVI
jgi:aspartyl-tRNA(Asn)/glutamyl-tRNA(Gln) amidotransferase subunit C